MEPGVHTAGESHPFRRGKYSEGTLAVQHRNPACYSEVLAQALRTPRRVHMPDIAGAAPRFQVDCPLSDAFRRAGPRPDQPTKTRGGHRLPAMAAPGPGAMK